MPAPVTGRVFLDNDADGLFSPGDMPLAGKTVQITEAVFNNGYVGIGVTDGNGQYSIDTTGLSLTIFTIQAFVNMDYSFCTTGTNPHNTNLGGGEVIDFGLKNCCTWFWQSRWVRKACWVFPNGQDNPGQFRLTFIHRKKGCLDVRTFIYQQATLAHYTAIIAAPSKGRWVLQNLKGWGKIQIAGN